jgi:L-lactate utilization protein LutC
MNSSDGSMENAAANDARRSAVGAFIDALKQRLRGMPAETAPPEQLEAVVRRVGRDDDLAARFTQAATSIGVGVHSATAGDWLDVVAGLLQAHPTGSVAIPRVDDGFLTAERTAQLEERLTAAGVAATDQTDDETLFATEGAITGVVAAVAEDGTLVCESQPGVARGSSLIPPVHIAVVASSQLLPDLYDYLERLEKRPELPANVNLITGPSKTSDIEGVLVTGVHGPRELHVVLVREHQVGPGVRP